MAEDKDLLAKKAQIEAEFLGKPGIHSVAIGHKQVKGVATNELAITVFTTKKKPIEELDADEIIPKFYAGIPTDVVEMPEFEAE